MTIRDDAFRRPMGPDNWHRVKAIFAEARSLPETERQAFVLRLCAEDPEVADEVLSLLECEPHVGAFIEGSALDAICPELRDETPPGDNEPTLVGTRIGAYQLDREIGRGGMGIVFEASRVDGEYEHRVAIKVIKRDADSSGVVRRFLRERQILASVSHPHIAQILDAGRTPDGRPYLVMELVNGVPIVEHCERHLLTPARRIQLFVQVCGAVEHAHRHQIVHRDLKPGNILVTTAGVPKLVDFGIAKSLVPEANTAGPATLAFHTPDYAAPEQLSGGDVTPAADVYALGVVLAEVLSGERPKRAVVADDPPRLPSRLSGDIRAIVATAIRVDPAERYVSASALADDLQRHADGRPIAAAEPSWRYRAGKFVVRHRIASAVIATAAAGLLVAITVAQYQARAAERRRLESAAYLAEARELVRTLLFESHDAVADLPGSTAMREMLVRRAIASLDKLAAGAPSDTSLQRELAAAYQRIGDVQSRLNSPNLGDTAGALASYQRARDISARVLEAIPADEGAVIEMAAHEMSVGDMLGKTGNAEQMLLHYRQALARLDAAAALGQSVRARDVLARTHRRVGHGLLRTGDLDGAMAAFQRALEVRRQLIAQHPGDLAMALDLSAIHQAIGFTRSERGEAAEALRMYEGMLAIVERASVSGRDDPRARRYRMQGHWWTAVGLLAMGRPRESLMHHDRALAIARELRQADPRNVQGRNDLGDATMERGNTLAALGRVHDAIASYEEAIAHYTAVGADDPTNVHPVRQVQYTTQHLAAAHARLGDHARAVALYRTTIDELARLSSLDGGNVELQVDLAHSHAAVGDLLGRLGDRPGAAAAFESARSLLEPLAARLPGNRRLQRDLAALLSRSTAYLPRRP